jgi:chemotaxis protein methyltransferase CheR
MELESEVEAIETRLVLEGIYAKYGYDFRDYAPDSIQRRLKSALAKSNTEHLGELMHRVLIDPKLFFALLADLTVQVSEMFRDPKFYRVFREKVVPVLRTYPQIKIWLAGCATGEEVYSTAIMMLEEDLYDRTQIYATDISAAAVERAREGIYPETSVEKFTQNYVAAAGNREFKEYYSTAYGQIAMREGLRKNVVFFQHDLVSDYALGEMHVIYCRNVLIYFGNSLRERVVGMFAGGLRRGGFLCLGASEALPKSQAHHFEEFSQNMRVFQRGEA